MYDLYAWKTANSQKVNIAVCELGVDVTVHPIDIGSREQFSEAFLTINPNNKVPVLVDRGANRTIIESGAILLYLAETERKLLPSDADARWEATQWIFWQMAGLGPTAGQLIYYSGDPQRGEHARRRFETELQRLLRILEAHLAMRDYVAGEYSMADIAIWPWISRFDKLGIDLDDYPAIQRWYLTIAARPAVLAGVQMLQPGARISMPSGRELQQSQMGGT